ncbi:uncharacterized protein V1518DRAFT_420687 [Limtongia smithiae]|uniref:uncharacterized protein n=1 Tax=Limtongia smithiae TaxID=1125753 RepID=UPI0034CDD272
MPTHRSAASTAAVIGSSGGNTRRAPSRATRTSTVTASTASMSRRRSRSSTPSDTITLEVPALERVREKRRHEEEDKQVLKRQALETTARATGIGSSRTARMSEQAVRMKYEDFDRDNAALMASPAETPVLDYEPIKETVHRVQEQEEPAFKRRGADGTRGMTNANTSKVPENNERVDDKVIEDTIFIAAPLSPEKLRDTGAQRATIGAVVTSTISEQVARVKGEGAEEAFATAADVPACNRTSLDCEMESRGHAEGEQFLKGCAAEAAACAITNEESGARMKDKLVKDSFAVMIPSSSSKTMPRAQSTDIALERLPRKEQALPQRAVAERMHVTLAGSITATPDISEDEAEGDSENRFKGYTFGVPESFRQLLLRCSTPEQDCKEDLAVRRQGRVTARGSMTATEREGTSSENDEIAKDSHYVLEYMQEDATCAEMRLPQGQDRLAAAQAASANSATSTTTNLSKNRYGADWMPSECYPSKANVTYNVTANMLAAKSERQIPAAEEAVARATTTTTPPRKDDRQITDEIVDDTPAIASPLEYSLVRNFKRLRKSIWRADDADKRTAKRQGAEVTTTGPAPITSTTTKASSDDPMAQDEVAEDTPAAATSLPYAPASNLELLRTDLQHVEDEDRKCQDACANMAGDTSTTKSEARVNDKHKEVSAVLVRRARERGRFVNVDRAAKRRAVQSTGKFMTDDDGATPLHTSATAGSDDGKRVTDEVAAETPVVAASSSSSSWWWRDSTITRSGRNFDVAENNCNTLERTQQNRRNMEVESAAKRLATKAMGFVKTTASGATTTMTTNSLDDGAPLQHEPVETTALVAVSSSSQLMTRSRRSGVAEYNLLALEHIRENKQRMEETAAAKRCVAETTAHATTCVDGVTTTQVSEDSTHVKDETIADATAVSVPSSSSSSSSSSSKPMVHSRSTDMQHKNATPPPPRPVSSRPMTRSRSSGVRAAGFAVVPPISLSISKRHSVTSVEETIISGSDADADDEIVEPEGEVITLHRTRSHTSHSTTPPHASPPPAQNTTATTANTTPTPIPSPAEASSTTPASAVYEILTQLSLIPPHDASGGFEDLVALAAGVLQEWQLEWRELERERRRGLKTGSLRSMPQV